MGNKADYENVVLDEEKDRSNYSYVERRTAIYNLIKNKGDPKQLPKYKNLADQFDVTKSQIGQDVERIKEYIKENLGKDAKVRTDFIYDKAIEKKVQNNQWVDAVEMIERKNNWLFNIGRQEKHNKDDVNVAVGVDNRTQVNQLMERLDDGLETARSEVKQGDKDFVVEKTEQVDPEDS